MKKQKETFWTWQFGILLAVNFASGMAGMSTNPLVASYAVSLGADLTVASTIAGIMSFTSLIMCPIAGVLADRVNRKKLLLFTMSAYAVCLLAHSFVHTIPMFILIRGLTGVFFSVNSVLTVAYASSFIPGTRMGEGLSFLGLIAPLAQAAGPAMGLALRDTVGYWGSFFAAACFGLAGVICIAILPYTKTGQKTTGKSLRLKHLFAVEFMSFMLITALFSAGNGLVTTYLDLVAQERSILNISLFFTVYSVAMVVSKPFVGRLLDTRGILFIMIPAILFAACGMFSIGIAYSLPLMLAAALFKAAGQGAGGPSIQAYVVKRIEPARTGVAVSTIQIGQNLGNAVAPVIGSFFVKSYGYTNMFCGFGVLVAAMGLLLLTPPFSRIIYQKQD